MRGYITVTGTQQHIQRVVSIKSSSLAERSTRETFSDQRLLFVCVLNDLAMGSDAFDS